jgi:hypothetical protein
MEGNQVIRAGGPMWWKTKKPPGFKRDRVKAIS